MPGGWGTAGFATGFSRGLGDVFSPYLMYMMMSQEGKAKEKVAKKQQELFVKEAEAGLGVLPGIPAKFGPSPKLKESEMGEELGHLPSVQTSPALTSEQMTTLGYTGRGAEQPNILARVAIQEQMKNARGIYESYTKDKSWDWITFASNNPIALRQIAANLIDTTNNTVRYVQLFEQGLKAATSGNMETVKNNIVGMMALQNNIFKTVKIKPDDMADAMSSPLGIEKLKAQLEKVKSEAALQKGKEQIFREAGLIPGEAEPTTPTATQPSGMPPGITKDELRRELVGLPSSPKVPVTQLAGMSEIKAYTSTIERISKMPLLTGPMEPLLKRVDNWGIMPNEDRIRLRALTARLPGLMYAMRGKQLSDKELEVALNMMPRMELAPTSYKIHLEEFEKYMKAVINNKIDTFRKHGYWMPKNYKDVMPGDIGLKMPKIETPVIESGVEERIRAMPTDELLKRYEQIKGQR